MKNVLTRMNKQMVTYRIGKGKYDISFFNET